MAPVERDGSLARAIAANRQDAAEQARVLVPQANTRITMRWTPNIDERCIIQFGTRTFAVGSVNNVEQRNLKLVLTCSEPKSV